MSALTRALDERRGLLMHRLEHIVRAEERGDLGSTWIELELLADEMRSLLSLYELALDDVISAR